MLAVIRYCVLLSLVAAGPSAAQGLGTIDFPTSGEQAAQSPFLEGVKALHSFQFDEARLAFQEAQRLDPSFALAYWGEAMSHNYPLWAQQNTAAARQRLEALAPTLAGRLAKAPTEKERALLEAVNVLFYGSEDKLVRDRAYSEHMARMHERWPDDHEVATFYALSLLGTVRPGDTGFRRQALAASIALRVFAENPGHPGAAHFIIHSFDDPEHAVLALPAARAYASIAPAAAHALHMPSHIFVQLGMWEEVAKSNIEAYEAAVEVNRRLNLPEGREDFHTLSWLAYANLMLGKLDDARANLELAREAVERNRDNAGILQGFLGMRARYILETGEWERIAWQAPSGHDGRHDMPGMSMAQSGSATWLFIAGVSAARLGDPAGAVAVAGEIAGMRERTAAAGEAYRARSLEIMENQVTAFAQLARGHIDDAIRYAKLAADIEDTMAAPSGPPEPIKPAFELYGELLLDAERPQEAMAAFERALERTPRRTPSLLGLARAAAASGNTAAARRFFAELLEMPGADEASAAVAEARDWLARHDG